MQAAVSQCDHKGLAVGSHPLLPMLGIPASVETRDDSQAFVGLNDKHQRVRKAPQKCAPNVLVNYRKLPWISGHPLDQSINCRTKSSSKSRSFVLIPILCVNQFPAGSWGKDDLRHYGQRTSSSAFNASHVIPSRRS